MMKEAIRIFSKCKILQLAWQKVFFNYKGLLTNETAVHNVSQFVTMQCLFHLNEYRWTISYICMVAGPLCKGGTNFAFIGWSVCTINTISILKIDYCFAVDWPSRHYRWCSHSYKIWRLRSVDIEERWGSLYPSDCSWWHHLHCCILWVLWCNPK